MRNQYSLEAMRELARAKQGKCLSQKYLNTKTKLLWECIKNINGNQPRNPLFAQILGALIAKKLS